MSEETTLQGLARWASDLRLANVPSAVREHAKNQILSTLAAVHSGYASDLGAPIAAAFPPSVSGRARALPGGVATSPVHAAFLMSAWSMVLDYDDVMLGGHTGHSSVLVPLAYADAEGHSGADLLLAQIVANELAARINMVCAVGKTRGQMATHLHLLGSATARAKLEGLSADTFAAALGFALSYPAKALFPAFLGSDAKTLCAAWPIRIGLESVDAVRAGLSAPTDVLDDPRGFFAKNATFPVREFLHGLGERWHTTTNSFKIYPACGYLNSVLDATLTLVRRHRLSAEEIESVEVSGSIFTFGMDAHSAPYLDGPRSPIAALTFSTPYTVAWAILDGDLRPEHFSRRKVEDPRVWELAKRVKVRHDTAQTIAALRGDIPIGAALSRVNRLQAAAFAFALATKGFGRRGRWRKLTDTVRLMVAMAASAGNREPLDFSHITKPLGTRVTIRRRDGQELSEAVTIPIGFAGSGDWREVRELMRKKHLDAAGTVGIDAGRAAEAVDLIAELDNLRHVDVRRLVELSCTAPEPTDTSASTDHSPAFA